MIATPLSGPAIAALTALVSLTTTSTPRQVVMHTTLFDFDCPGESRNWIPLNDTVMGGVSRSSSRQSEHGALVFAGEVSLENNGGFASLRARNTSPDLSDYDALILRVRGDGQRYDISIQTDYRIMAGAYYFSIRTEAGQWQEIRAPFDDFIARSFGRPLRSAPPLNRAAVRGLGLMISDKQAGPFRLEVDWIKAERVEAPATASR